MTFDRFVEISTSGNFATSLATFNVTAALEAGFDEEASRWLAIGKKLGLEKSAGLAHTPACVANASDFGQMLAWTRVVRGFVPDDITTLVICPDPWMFRHLQSQHGIASGRPPPAILETLKFWIRGYAARAWTILKLFKWFIKLRRAREKMPIGTTALVVYGHPNSAPNGEDGYFGDLIFKYPSLARVLHVDCQLSRALALGEGNTTFSLHAWGSFSDLFFLLTAKWRPSSQQLSGRYGWLVRRAAVLEGSTGQGAVIEWQRRCQARWLKKCRPRVVTWPWENHSWEREFVREARRNGVRTVGYQHSVIGHQMLNYHSASNPDGLGSIPDKILCTGQAMADQLREWNFPEEMLEVGGAFRFKKFIANNWDPQGPVYIALPFDDLTSEEMLIAARSLVKDGFEFSVKPHPMSPYLFSDQPGVTTTEKQFYDEGKLSAVIYAASAVGLDAFLAGLPTIRFRPTNRISLDILPSGIQIPVAGRSELKEALTNLATPAELSRDLFFSSVNLHLWRKELELEA